MMPIKATYKICCIAVLSLLVTLGVSSAAGEPKIKKLWKFDPQKIITFEYEGKIFKAPYGYVFDNDTPKLKAEGVNKLPYYAPPDFQYLWPSYAPVPAPCTRATEYCEQAPVKGFKAPPKGQKQTVIRQIVVNYYELKSAEGYRQNAFRLSLRQEDIKKGNYKVRKDIGMEVMKARSITHYRALDAKYQHLYLHCVDFWCRIEVADPDKSWTYSFDFNRSHLKNWRQIYEGRKRILKMFPPQ